MAIILIIVSYTDFYSITVIASNFLDAYNLNMNLEVEPQSSNVGGNNSGTSGGPSGGGPSGGGPNPDNNVLSGAALEQDNSKRNSSSSRMSGISSNSADIETEKQVNKLNAQNILEDPNKSDKDKMLELYKLYNEKADETAELKRERNNLKRSGTIPIGYDPNERATASDTGAPRASDTGRGTSSLSRTSSGVRLNSRWSSDSSDINSINE